MTSPTRRSQLRDAKRRFVALRLAAGLCVQCGGPNDARTQLCAECVAFRREQNRDAMRQRRAAALARQEAS